MIKYRELSNGKVYPQLVSCPVCGKEIKSGSDARYHLLNDHQPEDFGLTPMQT